jgi:hypothetical protein
VIVTVAPSEAPVVITSLPIETEPAPESPSNGAGSNTAFGVADPLCTHAIVTAWASLDANAEVVIARVVRIILFTFSFRYLERPGLSAPASSRKTQLFHANSVPPKKTCC